MIIFKIYKQQSLLFGYVGFWVLTNECVQMSAVTVP